MTNRIIWYTNVATIGLLLIAFTGYKANEYLLKNQNTKKILLFIDFGFDNFEENICYIILQRNNLYYKLYDTVEKVNDQIILNHTYYTILVNGEHYVSHAYKNKTIDKEDDHLTIKFDENICYYIFKTENDAETFLSKTKSHGGKRAKRRSRRWK